MDIEVLSVGIDKEEIELLDTTETPRVIGVWTTASEKPAVTVVGTKLSLCYKDGRVQEVFSGED